MINSKEIFQNYLACDKEALGIKNDKFTQKIKEFFFPNHIWLFQKCLRKVEYYGNTRNNIFQKIKYYYIKFLLKKISIKLGLSIPENVFGPGLAIVHYGTIVINSNARIGKNCRIHACTNIGASGGKPEAPQLGDNVYIGPGAKIYGNIKIANNTAIGANAVVNKSFLEENTAIAGVPAKVIGKVDIKKIIKHI